MNEYRDVISCRRTLQTDINYWESKGYELVSHAVCSNNNISLLFKRATASSANKPIKDAVVEDDSFDLVVLSALLYTLPQHNYMPYAVRDYILKSWTKLQNKHWAILRAIREYIQETVKWDEDHKERESSGDRIYLKEWIEFYNKLLTLKDTYLHSNFQHLKEPIYLKSETEHNPN